MEFFLVWLGTILVSVPMEIINELKIIKDAADAGYKLDLYYLKEITAVLSSDGLRLNLSSLLVPFKNIVKVIKRKKQYDKVKPTLLKWLDDRFYLKPMSELEWETYKLNRTGLNALLTPSLVEKKQKMFASVKLYEEEDAFNLNEEQEEIDQFFFQEPIDDIKMGDENDELSQDGPKLTRKR